MKVLRIPLFVFFCLVFAGVADANKLTDQPPTIFYPEGHYLEGYPRKAGHDMYGYTYQAHKFIGYFANVYLGGDGLPPYSGDTGKYYDGLVAYGYFESAEAAHEYMSTMWYWSRRNVRLRMYWNEAWMSNQDRADGSGGGEPDGNLDRHYGFPTYFDSGAELIQYQTEPILVEHKGKVKTVKAYYYSRIVAVPSDAVLIDDVWYTADGVELGPEVYGSFARVETVDHNPLNGEKPRGPAWGRRIREARP